MSLSLRAIADNTAELERAIAAGDVKVPANADPSQERQMLLAVANRPIDTNTTFTALIIHYTHKKLDAATSEMTTAGEEWGGEKSQPYIR